MVMIRVVPRTRFHIGPCGEVEKRYDILGLACVRSFWPAENYSDEILERLLEGFSRV